MLLYGIYPSQARHWCFKWRPPVSKPCVFPKAPFCLSPSHCRPSLMPLVLVLYLFFPLKISVFFSANRREKASSEGKLETRQNQKKKNSVTFLGFVCCIQERGMIF